jgi:PHAX RNA-binding domain
MRFTPEEILTHNVPPKTFDATVLAQVLDETEPEPQQQLVQLLDVLGAFGTWRLLQKTLDLEARGGVMIASGKRRRTPGGTFLWLARQWCQRKQEKAAFIVVPTLERTLAALSASLPSGECVMKTTVIGTPGTIVDRETYVAFKMTGKPAASLPKGLPKAPPTTLTWIVMVAKRQWAKAAASLQTDPKTKVIIEGYSCLHGTAHVLLATQCTTTALQQAKRGDSPDRQEVHV